MNIDGKENVTERIKLFESDDFTTYLYKFENGNQYKDTVSKWKQTSRDELKGHNPDRRLGNNYWERI